MTRASRPSAARSAFSEVWQVDCHIFREARAPAVSKWALAVLKSWTERSARPDKLITGMKLWSVSYQWCGQNIEVMNRISDSSNLDRIAGALRNRKRLPCRE